MTRVNKKSQNKLPLQWQVNSPLLSLANVHSASRKHVERSERSISQSRSELIITADVQKLSLDTVRRYTMSLNEY
jgi:hypothetical protein